MAKFSALQAHLKKIGQKRRFRHFLEIFHQKIAFFGRRFQGGFRK